MIRALVSVVAVVVVLLLAPLLDGVERKIRARIHSRIGPSVLQTWYDILKLFEKELVIPGRGLHIVLLVLLYLVLVLVAIVSGIAVVVYSYYLGFIAVVVLFLFVQAVSITLPFTTSNPFAIIGGSREVVLALVNEVFFTLSIALLLYMNPLETAVFRPSIYLLIALMLIASYVASGRVPFDIAEAEPELASGALIEFSGPMLGVFMYSNLLKRFFIKLLPIMVLLWVAGFTGVKLLVYGFIGVIALWIIYAVIASLLGRTRVDIAPISLLKIYLPFIIVSILLYIMGY